jgi:hypothetical protein
MAFITPKRVGGGIGATVGEEISKFANHDCYLARETTMRFIFGSTSTLPHFEVLQDKNVLLYCELRYSCLEMVLALK